MHSCGHCWTYLAINDREYVYILVAASYFMKWRQDLWMNFSVAFLYPNNYIPTKAANLSRESYRRFASCSKSRNTLPPTIGV